MAPKKKRNWIIVAVAIVVLIIIVYLIVNALMKKKKKDEATESGTKSNYRIAAGNVANSPGVLSGDWQANIANPERTVQAKAYSFYGAGGNPGSTSANTAGLSF